LKSTTSTPKNLSSEAKSLWRRLVAEYGIGDEGGFQILRAGLEAFDRMRGAQAQIAKDGITLTDRFGQAKAHPLLPVERDARAQYLAALKAMNLDLEPLHDRPGRPGGA
jgi:P27 family predicted phage terminase small subunit